MFCLCYSIYWSGGSYFLTRTRACSTSFSSICTAAYWTRAASAWMKCRRCWHSVISMRYEKNAEGVSDHLNGGQREQSFDCWTKPGAHIPKLSIFIDWAILSDFLSWFDTFLISYSWPYWSDSLVICNASDWLKGSLYVTPKWLRLLISLSFSHFRLLFYFWRLQIKSNFGFWWGE